MDDLMYIAMARGIFLGLADSGNMDAIFLEVNGDWYSAMNDPEKVKKLAGILKDINKGNSKGSKKDKESP